MLLHALQVMHIMVTYEMFNGTNSYIIMKSRYLLDGPRMLTFKAKILAMLVNLNKYGTLMCIYFM